MIDRTDQGGNDLVCVDPEWGDQLWRLDEPDLDPVLSKMLADHLFICDACRAVRETELALAAAIAAGDVSVAARIAPVVRLPIWRWAGTAVVAASLALLFILPPDGRQVGGPRRGEASQGFERPVEGEVLVRAAPTLRWAAVPGASSYRVEVSEVGGDYHWSAGTDEPFVQIPADHSLPADGIFRGVVQTVPADLVGPADISVAFSRSDWRRYVAYRFGAAPPWLYVLGGIGLLGLVVPRVRIRRRGPLEIPAE